MGQFFCRKTAEEQADDPEDQLQRSFYNQTRKIGDFFCPSNQKFSIVRKKAEVRVDEQRRSDIFLNQSKKIEAFFFPSKDNEKILTQELLQAKKTLLICVYTITNKNILLPLIEQIKFKRQLSIKIISDDYQTLGAAQKALLFRLQNEGKQQVKYSQLIYNEIQIKLDTSMNSCMHNKYAVIDDNVVITGSFNWTSKAVSTNRENIVIIRDQQIAFDYKKNFELLWAMFLPLDVRLQQQQQEKDKKELKKQEKEQSPGNSKNKQVTKKQKDKDIKIIKKVIQKQKPKSKQRNDHRYGDSDEDDYNPETSLDSESLLKSDDDE